LDELPGFDSGTDSGRLSPGVRLSSSAGLEAPNTYRDALANLAKHRVLDEELGKRLQLWAGMRNVLVHLYPDIDHGITWGTIRNDLGDLRRLAEIAAAKF
jgi:uncharacterized protein YutE (UPF0331/DUF86 family)